MLFKRRSQARALTGVYISSRGLAVASVQQDKGRKATLTQAQWCEFSTKVDISRLLQEQVSASRQPVNLVMADDHYQLLLVEAPRVEPSELRAAMRWKVKNLIDFHIDDAVIDVFEIPGQENRPQGQSMMYAIAARAREVREQIDLFEQAELNLQVIDVTEMALRNLAAQLEEDVRGVAMLYLDDDHGIVTLTRQASLYLSRRLEVGSTALLEDPEGSAAQIILEIQRSLDYYDSHFAQPPLVALSVLPGFPGEDTLIDALNDGLNLQAGLFDTASLLDCQTGIEPAAPAALLLAVGGALRQEDVSL